MREVPAEAEIQVAVKTDQLTRALRIIAKHAQACADELDPDGADPEDTPDAADQLERIKAERAERHKRQRMPE